MKYCICIQTGNKKQKTEDFCLVKNTLFVMQFFFCNVLIYCNRLQEYQEKDLASSKYCCLMLWKNDSKLSIYLLLIVSVFIIIWHLFYNTFYLGLHKVMDTNWSALKDALPL